MVVKTLAKYRLHIVARTSDRVNFTRMIHFYDAEGFVGYMRFDPDDQILPDNATWQLTGKDMIRLYMHESDYPDVVDLLRNEKPLYLVYRSAKFGFVGTTQDEPIGAAEGPE